MYWKIVILAFIAGAVTCFSLAYMISHSQPDWFRCVHCGIFIEAGTGYETFSRPLSDTSPGVCRHCQQALRGRDEKEAKTKLQFNADSEVTELVNARVSIP